jgi:hypothetical protein
MSVNLVPGGYSESDNYGNITFFCTDKSHTAGPQKISTQKLENILRVEKGSMYSIECTFCRQNLLFPLP